MAKLAIACNQATLTTTYKTVGIATAAASAPRRGRLYDLLLGASAAPNATDCNLQLDVSRQTAAGTTTSVTPVALDPADVNFTTLGGSNATVEGTITASTSLLNFGFNQRAAYRWVASDKGELVWPATASVGLALRCLSPTYASSVAATLLVDES